MTMRIIYKCRDVCLYLIDVCGPLFLLFTCIYDAFTNENIPLSTNPVYQTVVTIVTIFIVLFLYGLIKVNNRVYDDLHILAERYELLLNENNTLQKKYDRLCGVFKKYHGIMKERVEALEDTTPKEEP